MIVEGVRGALLDGRSPLLLSSRTEHLDYLEGRLRELCQQVFTLKGGMGTKQRKQIAESLSAVAPQEPRLILATGSYLGEASMIPVSTHSSSRCRSRGEERFSNM